LSRLKKFDRLWLRLQNLKPEGFYIDKILGLEENEFLVFTGKLLGGLCTPVGTVCINKKLLENQAVKELILLHEYAHKKDPLRFIFYSTGILVLFSTFFGGFVGAFATIVSAILLSWVMELKAEAYTAKHMGKKYFEAKAEAKRLVKGKPPTIYRLLNPPKALERYMVNRYREHS